MNTERAASRACLNATQVQCTRDWDLRSIMRVSTRHGNTTRLRISLRSAMLPESAMQCLQVRQQRPLVSKMSLRARRTTASSSRGAGKPYNDHATRKTMTEQRVMSECMTGLRFLQVFPLVLLAHRTQKVLLRVRKTTAGSSRSADKLHPHPATPQATLAHSDLTSVSARPLDV